MKQLPLLEASAVPVARVWAARERADARYRVEGMDCASCARRRRHFAGESST